MFQMVRFSTASNRIVDGGTAKFLDVEMISLLCSWMLLLWTKKSKLKGFVFIVSIPENVERVGSAGGNSCWCGFRRIPELRMLGHEPWQVHVLLFQCYIRSFLSTKFQHNNIKFLWHRQRILCLAAIYPDQTPSRDPLLVRTFIKRLAEGPPIMTEHERQMALARQFQAERTPIRTPRPRTRGRGGKGRGSTRGTTTPFGTNTALNNGSRLTSHRGQSISRATIGNHGMTPAVRTSGGGGGLSTSRWASPRYPEYVAAQKSVPGK